MQNDRYAKSGLAKKPPTTKPNNFWRKRIITTYVSFFSKGSVANEFENENDEKKIILKNSIFIKWLISKFCMLWFQQCCERVENEDEEITIITDEGV